MTGSLPAVAALVGLLLVPAPGPASGQAQSRPAPPPVSQSAPASPPESVNAMRGRAREILAGVQEHELPLAEARRQIEQLLRDLKALGEAEGWTPVHRRLEMVIARPEDLRPTLTEECPLFFEEELIQLCPLDQSRSEIWGNQVLVCEFACAPNPDPTR